MFGSWGQALKLSHKYHNGQRSEQTCAYHCILPFQRCHVDHSLGTAALQEGRPKIFTVGSGDGQGFRLLALMWRGWHFAQNQIPFRGAWHSALLRNSNRKEKNSNLLPLILLIPHKKWSSNAILKRKILDMEDARLHTQVSPAFLCSTNPAAIRQFHNPKQI